MDNQEKRTKLERTTQEQLQHYIMFCKQHPELQRGKLTPTNPQELQMLWSELADTLNALRCPTRSAAKWKESLMHWKHQLRSRERQIKAHAQVTGGGPPIQGISAFEEQAIETFGAAAVDGLPGVGTLRHQGLPPVHINTEPELLMSSHSPPAPAVSQTARSIAPAFPALSSSPSLPISPLILSFPILSSSLSPPILSSPIPSPSTYIPSAAKMFGAVLKKMEDLEKREEEAIALQRKIVEQNEQMTAVAIALQEKIVQQNELMTGVLSQISQTLTSMPEVMCKLGEKSNK